MYRVRVYRDRLRLNDLTSFKVRVRETDLYLLADRNLERETKEAILRHRTALEEYIRYDPVFKETLKPYRVGENAPSIVQAMAEAGFKAGVGPMAGVAGAMAEFVGLDLLNYTEELIIENGGDIFIMTRKRLKIGIFAGTSPFSNRLALKIEPQIMPLGICTSSGRVGHSLSFGQADAVTTVSSSTVLADAAATAICNIIQNGSDITKGIDLSRKIDGIRGVVIIIGSCLGLFGEVELIPIGL